MAITVCSSAPTPSPTLPTISPKSSSVKTPHQINLHHSKSNLGLSSNNNHALVIARESLASAYGLQMEAAEQRVESGDWRNGRLIRRRKRRKRREGGDFDEDGDKGFSTPLMAVSGSKSGKYLTVQEEAEYSLYIKEEMRLESVRKQILESTDHEPTTKQWAKAAGMRTRNLTKSICNGKMSQERVLRCYRRLVFSIANSYQGKGLSLADLIQEGSIGLISGVKKFDHNKGCKMSTYIYYWIRQAMIKAIAEKSRVVRLPLSVCAKLPKLAEINTNLSRRLHRAPSPEEIAEAADMNVATVRLICLRIRSPISSDHQVNKRGKISVQDIISGPKEMTPEAMVKRQHMKKDLEKLVESSLCEREAVIVRLYYGLNGKTPQSYEEIGKMFKISRERVRQLRRIAISKLSDSDSSVIYNLKMYTM